MNCRPFWEKFYWTYICPKTLTFRKKHVWTHYPTPSSSPIQHTETPSPFQTTNKRRFHFITRFISKAQLPTNNFVFAFDFIDDVMSTEYRILSSLTPPASPSSYEFLQPRERKPEMKSPARSLVWGTPLYAAAIRWVRVIEFPPFGRRKNSEKHPDFTDSK